MAITPPRHIGPYKRRQEDCQLAIERHFLREMVNRTTPYVDLDRVLTEISEEAAKAGLVRNGTDRRCDRAGRALQNKTIANTVVGSKKLDPVSSGPKKKLIAYVIPSATDHKSPENLNLFWRQPYK